MARDGSRPPGPGRRGSAVVKVRGTRRRKASSTQWLLRQLNDPYVAEARRLGYRSRAAFKLIELDERFRLLRPGRRVVDLGCAPGGWTQVAALLSADIRDPGTPAALTAELGGLADIVLSDMAPPATGHAATDHLRIVALAEDAFTVASQILKPGGAFVVKVFQGGAEGTLLAALKHDFVELRHAKPPASRSESAETYVVATGFRGGR